MRFLGFLAVIAIVPIAVAEIAGCNCDPGQPATLEARQCSLTREALAQPATPPIFFVKDINPTKPNRTLALPRAVRKDLHGLSDMTPAERLEFWTEAIRKAKQMWGDDWGLAINGDHARTQCQPHVHIGKFLGAAENSVFSSIDSPAKIPVPSSGEGLWIHQASGKLHVHTGEDLTETVLMR